MSCQTMGLLLAVFFHILDYIETTYFSHVLIFQYNRGKLKTRIEFKNVPFETV